MTQETFIIFVSIAAVFFAGAAVGQLLLRLQLARIRHVNLKLDRKILSSLSRSREPLSLALHQDIGNLDLNENEIREEIDALVNEIERS